MKKNKNILITKSKKNDIVSYNVTIEVKQSDMVLAEALVAKGVVASLDVKLHDVIKEEINKHIDSFSAVISKLDLPTIKTKSRAQKLKNSNTMVL